MLRTPKTEIRLLILAITLLSLQASPTRWPKSVLSQTEKYDRSESNRKFFQEKGFSHKEKLDVELQLIMSHYHDCCKYYQQKMNKYLLLIDIAKRSRNDRDIQATQEKYSVARERKQNKCLKERDQQINRRRSQMAQRRTSSNSESEEGSPAPSSRPEDITKNKNANENIRQALRATLDLDASSQLFYQLERCAEILANLATCLSRDTTPEWEEVKQLYSQNCRWEQLFSLRKLQRLCNTIEQNLKNLEAEAQKTNKLSVSSCSQLRNLVISLEKHGHNLHSNPHPLLNRLSSLHRNYCKYNCRIKFENSEVKAQFSGVEEFYLVAFSEHERAEEKRLFVLEQAKVVAVVGGERWTCGSLSEEQIIGVKQSIKIADLERKLKQLSRTQISKQNLLQIRSKVKYIENELETGNRQSLFKLKEELNELIKEREEQNECQYKYFKGKLWARVGGERFSQVASNWEEQQIQNSLFYLSNRAIIDVRKGINGVCAELTHDQKQDLNLITKIRQTLARFEQLDSGSKVSQKLCDKALTLANEIENKGKHLKQKEQLADVIQMYCNQKVSFKCVTRIEGGKVWVKLAQSENYRPLASSYKEMNSLGSKFFMEGNNIVYEHENRMRYPCGNLSPDQQLVFHSAAGKLSRIEEKISHLESSGVNSIKCSQISRQLLDWKNQMGSSPAFLTVLDFFDSKCLSFTKGPIKHSIFSDEDTSCSVTFVLNREQKKLLAQRAHSQQHPVSLSKNPNILSKAAYFYSGGKIYSQFVEPPIVCRTLNQSQIATIETIQAQRVFIKLQTLYDDHLTDIWQKESRPDDKAMCQKLKEYLEQCASQIKDRSFPIGLYFPAYLYDVATFASQFVQRHCKITTVIDAFPGVLTRDEFQEFNSMTIELLSRLRLLQNNLDFTRQGCEELLSYLLKSFHSEQILYSSLSQIGRGAAHELLAMFSRSCEADMVDKLKQTLPINLLVRIPCPLSFKDGQIILYFQWPQQLIQVQKFSKVALEDDGQVCTLFDPRRNLVQKKLSLEKDWFTFCVPSQEELASLAHQIAQKISQKVTSHAQNQRPLTKPQCKQISQLMRNTPNNLWIQLDTLKRQLSAINQDQCRQGPTELISKIERLLEIPLEQRSTLCSQLANMIMILTSQFPPNLKEQSFKIQRTILMEKFRKKCNQETTKNDQLLRKEINTKINLVCQYQLKDYKLFASSNFSGVVRINMNFLDQNDYFILRGRRLFVKIDPEEFVQCAQISKEEQKLLQKNIFLEMERIRQNLKKSNIQSRLQHLQIAKDFIQYYLPERKEVAHKKAREQFLHDYHTTRAHSTISQKILKTQKCFNTQMMTAQLCDQIALEIKTMIRPIQDHIQGQNMDCFDSLMTLYNKNCIALNEHSLMWYLSDEEDSQQFRWSQNGHLEVKTLTGFQLVKINQAHKQRKEVLFKYENSQIYKYQSNGNWLWYTEGQKLNSFLWREFFKTWKGLNESIKIKKKKSKNYDEEKQSIKRLLLSIPDQIKQEYKNQYSLLLKENKKIIT